MRKVAALALLLEALLAGDATGQPPAAGRSVRAITYVGTVSASVNVLAGYDANRRSIFCLNVDSLNAARYAGCRTGNGTTTVCSQLTPPSTTTTLLGPASTYTSTWTAATLQASGLSLAANGGTMLWTSPEPVFIVAATSTAVSEIDCIADYYN